MGNEVGIWMLSVILISITTMSIAELTEQLGIWMLSVILISITTMSIAELTEQFNTSETIGRCQNE